MVTHSTRPDASMPTELTRRLAEKYDAHASGGSRFKQSGVTYEVTVWIDGGPRFDELSDVADMMDQAGYEVTGFGIVEETGNLRIHGEAFAEK